MNLSLNTYSECVAAFREADQLMGSAFRQKLSAFTAAREQYIARNQHKNNPDWGFISKFAADCGVSQPYISGIGQIASNPKIISALINFSSVGYDTALALSKSDPDIIDTALEQLEQTGELVERDITEIETELSEFETAQIDRDIELEREKTRKQILEYIQPSDSDISRFTHFLFSAGIQLDTYQQKTGEQLTAEKIADFIVQEALADSDRYSGDPEIFAESIRDLRQIVDLFGRALELVSDQRPPKLTIVK